MIKEDIQERIVHIVNEQCLKAELDCIACKMHRQGSVIHLDVIADQVSGGISISQCTQLNKAIIFDLDEWGALGEDYTVNVSSPGLDRPLTDEKDFYRVKGREVRFHFAQAQEGKLEATGIVCDVRDGFVVIENKKGTMRFSAANVTKAFQIF